MFRIFFLVPSSQTYGSSHLARFSGIFTIRLEAVFVISLSRIISLSSSLILSQVSLCISAFLMPVKAEIATYARISLLGGVESKILRTSSGVKIFGVLPLILQASTFSTGLLSSQSCILQSLKMSRAFGDTRFLNRRPSLGLSP